MKTVALIVWVGLAGLASFALFNITFKVEELQNQLSSLNKQILQEQKAVHVLQAEWSYLSRPERIEALSQRLLPHLQAPTSQQIGDVEKFSAQTTSLIESDNKAIKNIRPAAAQGQQ